MKTKNAVITFFIIWILYILICWFLQIDMNDDKNVFIAFSIFIIYPIIGLIFLFSSKWYKKRIKESSMPAREVKLKNNVISGLEDFFGILAALPSLIFGLVILFIIGVVAFAIVKWAFQIVF